MKEVTVRVLDLSNNCYLAVLDHHWKYLNFLKNTEFKNNVIIKSWLKTMLSNKHEIKMPIEQWNSYLWHVYNVDKSGKLSQLELKDHIVMGSFIHHQEKVKTGARSQFGKVKEEKEILIAEVTNEIKYHKAMNETLRDINNTREKAAIGAADGMYVKNIVIFLSQFNAWTTIYLNTQTGSANDRNDTILKVKEFASETLSELASCVNESRLPDVNSAAMNGLWYAWDILIRTPFNYAKGNGMHLVRWGMDSYKEHQLTKILKDGNIPNEYKSYAALFEKFKNIPVEEFYKHGDKDYLLKKYNDPDVESDMYHAFGRIMEKLELREKSLLIGEYGNNRIVSNERLLNGRKIMSLMSHAKVWNEFDMYSFGKNAGYALGNVFLGEGALKDSAENNIIRLKTITTVGILGMTVMYPCALKLWKMTKQSFYKEAKLAEMKRAERFNDAYYDERRKYRGWREGMLDLIEYSTYTFLVMTALIEFIGITNVVGKEQALDTFISDSYSSEWYYLTGFAYLRMLQIRRQSTYTANRNPDNDFQNSMPFITQKSLEFVLAVVSSGTADNALKNLGLGNGSMEAMSVIGTFVFIQFLTMSDRLLRSTGVHVIDNVIETHASLMKDNPHEAKLLRERLMHNKKFRRAVMTHLCKS